MDLISCQNVLIYLETRPQHKIIQTFHYALKPTGYLFLGKSETIGTATDLFESMDKKIKLYSRKPTNSPQLEFTIHTTGKTQGTGRQPAEHHTGFDIEKVMEKLLLSRFVHPSVVVNKNLAIIQFFGMTSPFLEPVTGKASFSILKMIREDLVLELGGLLQQARKTEKVASKEGIRIYTKKIVQEITIEVVPKKVAEDIYFLVVFKELAIIPLPARNKGTKKDISDQKDKMIAKLEEELAQSRGLVRATNDEYETTYEELQANSEEVLSSNEELQSVNEELETSKEELQSSNEELTTINEELHTRNIELAASQKELQQVNEQLKQFAFISSHDLQEPLRKITTFANLLFKPEADLNEYALKYANKINTSAVRVSELIKDLLSFSLLVQKQDKKPVSVNLNDTIKNVMEDFEVMIAQKKAVIHLSLLPTIHAEPVQMNQLFYNLIGNALKFSRETPIIKISSRKVTQKDFSAHPELIRTTSYVAISVADNGIGFDEKYVNKMFLLFQRLHDLKEVKGTGIGLAICKKIVEDHHGFLFAKGQENAGATFMVFLPEYP